MRFSLITQKLVHTDQVGFVAGRQASDGIRRFVDLIQWAERYQMPFLLLSLDTEKAFDRVNLQYLKAVLHKFGFTGNSLHSILSLYSAPSAKVRTSGIVSDPFAITNGTRHGCPLSTLIFALVMEPLAQTIRTDPHITGIKVRDTTHKIGLYADDVIISLTDPVNSLPHLQRVLAFFSPSHTTKSIIANTLCWIFVCI